jgi:hypothetical protein
MSMIDVHSGRRRRSPRWPKNLSGRGANRNDCRHLPANEIVRQGPHRCAPAPVDEVLKAGAEMDKLKISTRLSARNKKPRATKMSEAKLDALIEEATVDAYDESEQIVGFQHHAARAPRDAISDCGAWCRSDSGKGRLV